MTIQLFNNDEFELSVEFVDDTFRIYGPNLAAALAVRDGATLARGLADDEKVQVAPLHTSVGRPDQQVWWITEPGFFRAVSQRQAARIKDATVRDRVERFQRWVFHEVLPAIRRRGHYSLIEDPQSLTWEQLSQLLYQRYGLKLTAAQITRALRTGGILRQNGLPRSKYQDWFWLTETGTVNVLDFHVPKVAARITETRGRLLERLQWHQLSLQLDGPSHSHGDL